MAEVLDLTHEQVVREVQSRAGLVERRDGVWRTTNQHYDDHQVAQEATDEILAEWHDLCVREPSRLTTVKDPFTWPANAEAIALNGPPLGDGHPTFTSRFAFVRALYDLRGGAENPATIGLIDEQMVQFGFRGVGPSYASAILTTGPRGTGLAGVIKGRTLEMHPTFAPSMDMRIDYVPYPDAVDPTSRAVYVSVPVDALRVAVDRAADALVVKMSDRSRSMEQRLAITERRAALARRFLLRVDRQGPRFTNYLWTVAAGS